MDSFKAQASVELLVILAVSMIAISLIIFTSNNEITSINSAKANSEAQNTVNKIAGTAEEVFISGPGTTKQIFVSIPSGVDETKTGISDKTVRLNVNGTDLIAESKIELTGSIPTEEGSYWIWITAYPGYVVVGDIKIETDKGSIYSTIAQDSTAIENIVLTNNTTANAQVNSSIFWSASEVSLEASDVFFVVPSGTEYGIDLNFTSGSSAVGNYSGEIVFDANTVDGSKKIVIPITVEVLVGGGEQPLMIFPDEWTAGIDSGSADSNVFQVCNTTNQTLNNIVFTASGGDAGDWIQSVPLISSLAGNTCQEITVTVDVPLGASSDSGTLTASDGSNSDFISLNITVNSMTDNFGFSWENAFFSDNVRLDNWTVENNSSSQSITISRVQVLDWNEADLDSALFYRIRFNGSTYWTGTADAGEWVDITDFTLNPFDSFTAGNRLIFTENARNNGESFRVVFEFSDGSKFTTPVYFSSDVFPPIVLLENPVQGFESDSFTVEFEFNVNDADSGIAFCELIIDGIVDQTDNSITEGITQSFTKVFSSNGSFNWDVNCTDDSVAGNEENSNENRNIIINSAEPAVIAFHVFPDSSWTSGTGWNAGWIHLGDTSITTIGTPHSFPSHLRLRRGTGYAARFVNLSPYNNPRLEFWAKVDSFESGDYLDVLVSSDGITWNVIKTFTSADSDNIYNLYEFDLNAFSLSNNFGIAFDAGMNSINDRFYVDDINIVQRTP